MKQNLRLGIDFPVPQLLAPMPYSYNYHGSAFVTGEERYIYWLIGYGSSTFYRYDTWMDAWNQLASAPVAPSSGGYGSAMVFDPSKQRIYAVFGNSTTFAYYDVKGNYWVTLATLPSVASASPQLEHTCVNFYDQANDDVVYYNCGDGSTNSTHIYKYTISTNTWSTQASGVLGSNSTGNFIIWLRGADPDKILFLRGNGSRTGYLYSISGNNIVATLNVQNSGGTFGTGTSVSYEPSTNEIFWIEAGTRFINKTKLAVIPLIDTGTATSGTSTTLVNTGKSWSVNRLKNCIISIISGTGAGQLRKIISNTATAVTVDSAWDVTPGATSVYEIKFLQVADDGIATSADSESLTDTSKSWEEDKLSGHYITIVRGTGAGQIKRITYNTSNKLYFYGTWTTIPDTTSVYEIKYTITEFGNVSSATSTVITDTSRSVIASENWPTNQFQYQVIRIIKGTGAGQTRYIASSTSNTITVSAAFTVTPDATSVYEIIGMRSFPEIYIPYSTSASYYGNTMVTLIIKGLLFIYCSRKGAQTDWFRWLSISP